MTNLSSIAVCKGGALIRAAACFVAISLAVVGTPSALADASGASCPRSDAPLQRKLELQASVDGGRLSDGLQILAIGSSSTEGVGASSPAQAYPAQLERTVEAELPLVEVRNAGVGGETVEATVVRLEQALAQSAKPDLVIWQVGTNDAIRGGDEAQFRVLLERGVAAVRKAGSQLIILDQQFYPSIPDIARYERFVRLVGSTAAASKAGLFSRYAMMKEWGTSEPGLLASMLAPDQFHMGDRGYRCLAEALGREIAWVVRPLVRPSVAATGNGLRFRAALAAN
jgi:acyl-CoA thioesterase-1